MTDPRFVKQILTLSLLVVLPIIMISLNGVRAVQSILNRQLVDSARNDEAAASLFSSAAHSDELVFGVYDPDGVFAEYAGLKIRHEYISWASFDPVQLRNRLSQSIAAGYRPLLTVEPWPRTESDSPTALLTSITNGDYDDLIDRVATSLRGHNGTIYVSWGHEMDQDLVERYPWSGKDPRAYADAYRYVVDRTRDQVDGELKWVWAGVLKEGSVAYWPGESYADFVGMPIYSFPEFDRKIYGYIRDFETTFREKCAVVEELNTPVIITELGVSGSHDFVSYWMHQTFTSLERYPNLHGVIFFHSRDTEGAWGSDIPTPDWRGNPDLIRGLVDWKLAETADDST